MKVLLDSGPLGMLCAPPKRSGQLNDCNIWLNHLLARGDTVYVPEIADYEVRRELIRINRWDSVQRLDALNLILEYFPLTTDAMRKAAELWAAARQAGRPTASDKNIDGDVILAAQALVLGVSDYLIATTNVRHVGRFANAQVWHSIPLDRTNSQP